MQTIAIETERSYFKETILKIINLDVISNMKIFIKMAICGCCKLFRYVEADINNKNGVYCYLLCRENNKPTITEVGGKWNTACML